MDDAPNSQSYVPVPLDEIPVEFGDVSSVNLYVYLSSQKRFALYVPKGDKITQARRESLLKHKVPCLYMLASDMSAGAVKAVGSDKNTPGNFEVIGLPGNKVLAEIFHEMSQSLNEAPKETITKLTKMSDEIMKTVAPDAVNLKARFMQNVDYLWLMNDASAISTLATMFAAAHGINNAKSLSDIVFAALVMDLPLVKIDEATMDLYFQNPRNVSRIVMAQIEDHPNQAYLLAKKNLPHLSDATFELIITHHERNDGSGYPRQLKSARIFPLGQIFAFAVEVFENMKIEASSDGAGFEKTMRAMHQSISFDEAEGRSQRHRKEIITTCASFLGIDLGTPPSSSTPPASTPPDSTPPPAETA